MTIKKAYLGLYVAMFVSLMFIDNFLGNGYLNVIKRCICKTSCFVKKSIFEVQNDKSEGPRILFNIYTFVIELIILAITRALLEKLKNRHADRLDELIRDSKESLRLCNELLEKWRMRRVPSETYCSYLDEEPQEIESLQLEVPILHMAIVDTWSAARKQQERGDAGDSAYSDPAVVSLVSVIEEGDNLTKEETVHIEDYDRNIEMQNRYLWDVEEEDLNAEY